MAGSVKSAIVFIISAVLFVIQMVISIAVFDDAGGAALSFAFLFIMIVGAFNAWRGGLAPVQEKVREYEVGGHTTVTEYRDTGQSIQCTPCFGIGGGIGSIIVVFLIAADLLGTELFLFLVPGILGGIFGIVAAIVFIIDYKGPWTQQRF